MHSYLVYQNQEQINYQDNLNQLESGKILFFPQHYLSLQDPSLMSDSILSGKHKNISYDYKRNKLGAYKSSLGVHNKLEQLMQDYAKFAYQLVQMSLPAYIPYLQWGRTSYRPAQIRGRVSSKRKDDTRLHIDSFAASPVNGLRILRVFCNINPNQEARIWHVGESFDKVLARFAPQIPDYNKFTALILKLIKSTKTLRSSYDHYMLSLHDMMKLDEAYQAQVKKIQIDFPAHSSWIVFTDQVSHAALSGQYVLEQTFYLPVYKMARPELSPLYKWMQYKPTIIKNIELNQLTVT